MWGSLSLQANMRGFFALQGVFGVTDLTPSQSLECVRITTDESKKS